MVVLNTLLVADTLMVKVLVLVVPWEGNTHKPSHYMRACTMVWPNTQAQMAPMTVLHACATLLYRSAVLTIARRMAAWMHSDSQPWAHVHICTWL
jgi:hypothetical protein